MSFVIRKKRRLLQAQCSGLINIPGLQSLSTPPYCPNPGGAVPLVLPFEQIEETAGVFFNCLIEETAGTFGKVIIDNIPANWFDINFKSRIPLTVKSLQIINGPETNFQTLLNGTFPELIGNVKSAGEDIRIVLPDKTELPYEIEFIDALTGQLTVWFNSPSLDTDTIIYVYFANPNAIDAQDKTGVWINNNITTLHLSETPPAINLDSTSNAIDFTPNVGALRVDGKIDGAASYNFTTMTETPSAILDNALRSNFTVMGWVNQSVLSAATKPLIFRTGQWDFGLSTNGTQMYVLFSGIGFFPKTVPTYMAGENHHIAFTVSLAAPTNVTITYYFDGQQIGTQNTILANAGTGDWIVGLGFEGIIDEPEIYDTVLTPDKIESIFNNQNNSSTFYNIGAVENIGVPANWFDTSYASRIAITVNPSQVPSTQTDFPLLFNSTITDFIANAKADGFDFRFALPDKTELSYERQSFDSVTGALITHTKIPSIQDGTVVYLYYNKPSADDGQDTPNVWDSSYHAVYHMSQTPGGAGTILDSTSNNFNATPSNVAQIDGQIGKALDYNGTSSFMTSPVTIPSLSITFEFWVKPNGALPVGIWDSGPGLANVMRNFDPGQVDWHMDDPDVDMNVNVGVFNHFVVVYRYDGNRHIDLYRDGVFIVTMDGGVSNAISWSNFRFGDINSGTAGRYDGILDEFRISTGISRSADYVTTSYNNQSTPETFYKLGVVENLNLPANWFDINFRRRFPITINPSQVPSTQTDFPLLINSIIPDLIDNVQANGEDIRIVLPDKTELKYEIQSIDSLTGEIIVWAKMPTISDADIVYVYYDNASATDNQDAVNVWDSNYNAVYHMNESSGDLINSTSNPQNAILNGTVIHGVPGQIGKAVDFNQTGHFNATDSIQVKGTNVRTVSCWANNNVFMGSALFQGGEIGTTNGGFSFRSLQPPPSENWRFQIWGPDIDVILPGSQNNYHHYTCVFDGINVIMYFDGVQKINAAVPLNTLVHDFYIGRWESDEFDGQIQEMRVSKINRTQDWVTTEYNNQFAPETFYTIGTVETLL